jgi:uncharacterized protein YgiM (DUF1202 family)
MRFALACLVPLLPAAAQQSQYWAVTGVARGDVLHLRDMPSADSRSLARIPPDARGLRHLGCRRNQPPLEQWMRMSQQQRQEAQTEWCRVDYRGKEGWVAGRFLKKDGR